MLENTAYAPMLWLGEWDSVQVLIAAVVVLFSLRLFRECPHPDEKQRLELSQRLGLEPRQVKFWFQNRRTQMKVRLLGFACLSPWLSLCVGFALAVLLLLPGRSGDTPDARFSFFQSVLSSAVLFM